MLSWQGHTHGGHLKFLFLSVFSLLIFFSSFQIIQDGVTAFKIITLITPFIFLGLIIYILDNNKVYAFTYFFIAFFTTMNALEYSDFSGSLGFIFSFHLVNKPKYGLFIIISTAISLSFRLFIMDETIVKSFIMLLIFSFWYISYYEIIFLRMPKPIKARIKQLSTDENKLLELMCAGYSQENAGSEIGHKKKQDTSKMMKDIREKLYIDQEESNYKVIALYLKYGK